MRILESVKWFVAIPFYPRFPLPDRFRLLFYYSKSLLNRFVFRRKPSNAVVKVSYAGAPLYFRDNWFDPRSVYNVFSNDYTALDRDIFKGIGSFVDIGSNLGFISRCASASSPGCKVFCFEPLADNARLCAMNNDGARVERLAIGSRTGSAELLVDQSGFMASSMVFGYSQKKQNVPVISLDGLSSRLPGEIDVVKIDVEGMEVEVLKGGTNVLGRAKRVVAEVHSESLMRGFAEAMEKCGFSERRRMAIDSGIYLTDWARAGPGIKPGHARA